MEGKPAAPVPSDTRQTNGAPPSRTRSTGSTELSYESRVGSSRRPTITEVQAQLEATTESMAGRLESLRSEVVGTRDGVARLLSENALVGVGTAVFAGAIVGYILTPSRRRSRRASDADELASLVMHAVRSSLDEGEDPTGRVSTLLRKEGSVQPAKPSTLRKLIEAAGLAALNLAVKEVSRRLAKDRD